MAGFTYDTLKAAIFAWTEEETDDALNDNIDMVMELAQHRVRKDLDLDTFIETVPSSIGAGVSVINRPDNAIEIMTLYRLAGGERIMLQQRSEEYLRDFWPNDTLTDPNPLFWAEDNTSQIIVAPTPSSNMPYLMRIRSTLLLLSSSNQTNWISRNAPDLLLYAAMMEADRFLQEDDTATAWDAMYDDRLPETKKECGSSRTSPERLQVTMPQQPDAETGNGN